MIDFDTKQAHYKFILPGWVPTDKRGKQMQSDIYTKTFTELMETENN